MQSETIPNPLKFEKRWPVALTILIVGILLWFIPERISLLPSWLAYAACIIMLIPIIAIGLTKADPFWLKMEKYILFSFLFLTGVGNFMNLENLIKDMLYKSSQIDGLQLLASSIAVWLINALMFSLLYWQIDRGGPEARQNNLKKKPDWFFTQDSAPEEFVPDNWKPVFVDYLYLAYSTSTAFSTTDVIPLNSKSKMLMMFQSFISLIIIVIVGARAINIIGS
ncbi:MAG: hypothetical protein KDD00_03575 [Ignavibacteriae bacterium]|nr:hypothetical protein [Ignavibacteriota bacterium]